MNNTLRIFALLLLLPIRVPADDHPEPGRFQPPSAGFFLSPGEKATTVELASLSGVEASRFLAEARRQNPDDALVIRLRGTIQIANVPLRLPGRTALILEAGASIVADKTATAGALVELVDTEFVSLIASEGPARLDGANRVQTGILIKNCGKIALDQLSITGCTGTGLSYTGRGWERSGDAGAVTRCSFTGCATGMTVRASRQFICLENTFLACGKIALDAEAVGALVANNRFEENPVAVQGMFKESVIARNKMARNGVGCRMTSDSTGTLVTENTLKGNATGLEAGGTLNTFLANQLENRLDIALAGKDQLLIANSGTQPEAAKETHLVFDPPTKADPHHRKIVAGKGRFDIALSEGGSLSAVQQALQQARRDHPDDIVVAQLKGLFVADGKGPTGLALPDDTCVILDGEIRAENEALREGVLMNGKGVASFSGGVIDCRGKGLAGKNSGVGIHAPGRNVALIDGVTVHNTRAEGISTKGHTFRTGAVVIRGCTVEHAGARAIWGHVAQNVIVLNCTARDAKMDGIDIDAFCKQARVLGNRCENNGRHGLFVEEAVSGVIAFANRLTGNAAQGVHVWNQEVKGNTGPNLLACNLCARNRRGIGVGGRTEAMTAHGNVFFNLVCLENQQGLSVTRNASDNYFCNTVLEKNPGGILDWTGKPGAILWLGRPPQAAEPVHASRQDR